MLKKPIYSLALVAMMGAVAACGGEEAEVADDAAVVDTLVTPEQTTVEVPVTVPDTAVVTRDVDVSVDTVDVEQGQVPPPNQ